MPRFYRRLEPVRAPEERRLVYLAQQQSPGIFVSGTIQRFTSGLKKPPMGRERSRPSAACSYVDHPAGVNAGSNGLGTIYYCSASEDVQFCTSLFTSPRAQLHIVEVLWKNDNPTATAREKEFVALRLVDLGLNVKPRFLIREVHAAWSDSEQRTMWNVDCDGLCCTPEEAQQQFAARKAVIVAKGFNCLNQPAANISLECVR